MTGYEFHPEVRLDFDEIWEFIRADNLDAADRVIAEILSAIPGLVRFPHQGHRRQDLARRTLRFKRVREYLIAYAQDEKQLWAIAVLHGHCTEARMGLRQPRVDRWRICEFSLFSRTANWTLYSESQFFAIF